MAMVMISILSSPVNTTHAFSDWSFWGWILSSRIGHPLNEILSHSHLNKNRKIILFFFPLSFLRRDEDYVIVYLKKIMYLSFSHKYILKIIHFFLFFTFFKDLIICLV